MWKFVFCGIGKVCLDDERAERDIIWWESTAECLSFKVHHPNEHDWGGFHRTMFYRAADEMILATTVEQREWVCTHRMRLGWCWATSHGWTWWNTSVVLFTTHQSHDGKHRVCVYFLKITSLTHMWIFAVWVTAAAVSSAFSSSAFFISVSIQCDFSIG